MPQATFSTSVERKLVYIMYNKEQDIEIECTKRFLVQWIARGFTVKGIRVVEDLNQ